MLYDFIMRDCTYKNSLKLFLSDVAVATLWRKMMYLQLDISKMTFSISAECRLHKKS